MNFTGSVQKSGPLNSSLPHIRNESDILNFFLMFLSKQLDSKDLINSSNMQLTSQTKILNNKNSMQDLHNIDFHTQIAHKMNFNKNSIDIDKYFTSNKFSKSSKIMNTIQMMNEKESYFSKN
jgi:hypothetical protein